MAPNAVAYTLALVATTLLTSGLALYAYGRRREGGRVKVFAGLLTAVSWYCGAAALEFIAPALPGKIIAAKLKFLGLSALGPLWLSFALRYARQQNWFNGQRRFLVALPSLAGAVLALTNEAHHLVWTGFTLQADSPGLIVQGRGPAFWLFMAAQYVLILSAAVIYAQAYAQAADLYRRQTALMIAGALAPLLGNAVYLAGFYPVPGLDLTPFGFGLSAVFLATGLFQFGLLAVQPIAARVVFDHLRDPVLVLDPDDRLIDVNPAARALFDLGSDALGQPAPAVLREVQHAAPAPGVASPQVAVGEGDQQRLFRVEFSPLNDAYGHPLGRLALLVDVSQERALQQMRDDLTHMLIHDLSNPLAAMQMALEMVQFDDGGPNQPLTASREARDALEIVRRSNQRAQQLVTSLLDISRLESGSVQVEAEAVQAGSLAETILAELQPWAGERQLALRPELAPDLPPVWADADLLDRVLRNLLGNAIKYTPAGGQITLSICPSAGEARFSVQDTGPGLPTHVKGRLFGKFVRGVGPGHGHGLGLAFCKLAVEAMHGRIWAESQPGQGTAFHFTLPLAA